AYIMQVHKEGSKQRPEVYRPVNLTSHIAKVFEKVFKKNVTKHLIDNNKLNNGQYGFMPGPSKQSELLAHYNYIYEEIIERKRLDTMFLDFAETLDKVQNGILLEKVKKQGIRGKLGRWTEEFLKNRKFRVVVNDCMS
ncbi:unnamed protein product, partial [Meganyctiphanes norvegica]